MAIPSRILAGESHGWRSLAGYGPWGHTELDTAEQLSKQASTPIYRHTFFQESHMHTCISLTYAHTQTPLSLSHAHTLPPPETAHRFKDLCSEPHKCTQITPSRLQKQALPQRHTCTLTYTPSTHTPV